MNKINLKSFIYNLLLPIFLNFIILMLIPNLSPTFHLLINPFSNVTFLLYLILISLNYMLIGVSAYFLENTKNSNNILRLYYYYLFLTLLIPVILFGFQYILLAIIIIIMLFTAAIYLLSKIWKANKTSAYFFLPNLLLNALFIYFAIQIYITH